MEFSAGVLAMSTAFATMSWNVESRVGDWVQMRQLMEALRRCTVLSGGFIFAVARKCSGNETAGSRKLGGEGKSGGRGRGRCSFST